MMVKVEIPTVAQLRAVIPTPERERFSTSRWPYTYAYDIIRQFPQMIPDEAHQALLGNTPSAFRLRVDMQSRADASLVVTAWAIYLGDGVLDAQVRDKLVRVLATLYCEHHGIDVPPGLTVVEGGEM